MIYRIMTAVGLWLAWCCSALAQQPAAASPDSADSAADRWQVSLITCAPGAEIYELEGHTGLRLLNEARNIDVVVNWGLFDFASPGFVYRFVKGETDYMAGAAPSGIFFGMYCREGRGVTELKLSLTDAQAAKVFALVENNLRPENRVYRYNYVADNCATRPLAVIERAIGDSLRLGAAEEAISRASSFREAMRYYHRNYPWYQFGIDLALGSTIDRCESRRAMTFSPVALEQMVAGATLPAGGSLVSETVTVCPGKPGGVSAGPTPRYLAPVTIGWVLLAVTLAVTLFGLSRRRLTRGFDVLLYTVFGLAGCLITFLVFFSVHGPASPNWLLLWLNPLCLLPLFLIWTKGGRGLLMWWQIINFVALIAMCVVWIAGVQAYNSAFIPLIISDGVRSLFFIFYNRCSIPPSQLRQPMACR